MKYTYTAILQPDADGQYLVTVPDLPGCATFGRDLYDAMMMGTDALTLWLTYAEEQGDAIPPASAPGAIQAEPPSFPVILCADTETYRKAYPLDWMPPDTEEVSE